MRKRQISPTPQRVPSSGQTWLDVEHTALVEVTSEENSYPIESALLGAGNQGWRAANPGTQTIRLIFDEPQKLRRIWLVFEDSENTRTQEFALRWSPDTGHSFREIVRQQWNFSPPESVREIEDYAVELPAVKVLELIIVPDKSGGAARASLASLRLA
jgi:F5/8 type C domain-containing protein